MWFAGLNYPLFKEHKHTDPDEYEAYQILTYAYFV